jgi:hypothetical protein
MASRIGWAKAATHSGGGVGVKVGRGVIVAGGGMDVSVTMTPVMMAGEGGTVVEMPGTTQADISTRNRIANPTTRAPKPFFMDIVSSRKLDGDYVPYGL